MGCAAHGTRGRRLTLNVGTEAVSAPVSARLIEVGLRFGVPLVVPGRQVVSDLEVDFCPGSIVLVTGPSGSGKSLILSELARQFATARLVQSTPFPVDVAVLEAVAPGRPVMDALGLLTACGLGEPMLWVRRFSQLSDGERFRARLARAIGVHRRERAWSPLLCDEFGAILHRRLAKAVAFNLRKVVTREGLSLVVATAQDDLEQDLQADTVIRLSGSPPVVERRPDRRDRLLPTFAQGLRIQRGTVSDYMAFSSMHYRQRGMVGYVDKVFTCRERLGGPVLAVVVYARSTLELRLRNQVTCRRFCRQAQRLNRELRLLKRLVVHPDVRGCGIGHWLVRRTLPMVETRFVECLAAMGAVNPIFEKAGMRRIGVCEAPGSRDEILGELRVTGADPLRADFVSQVCRRPAVRRLVARGVLNWYRATSCAGDERLAQQTPTQLAQTFRQLAGSEPVYYLWAADVEGWELIDRGQRGLEAAKQTAAGG